MDKKTKLKVTLITIVGVVVALIYFRRESLISDFKREQRQIEWEKNEPQGQLINGHKNGEWKTFFKNGQLARAENYINDTLHGKQISFTPEGHFNSRAKYNMGVKVDSFFLYHSNGRINSEEFKDSLGRMHGLFKIYDSNGQTIQIGQSIHGEFDGEFRTFFNTGQLKTIKYYKLGEPTGQWIEFSDKGDTIKVEQY